MNGLVYKNKNILIALWVLYFLQSMKFAYLWLVPGGIFGILILLISLISIHISNVSRWVSLIFLGLLTFALSYDYNTIYEAINILVLPLDIAFLVIMPWKFKRDLIFATRNTFFYIFVFSLPFFLLYQIGLDVFNIGPFEYNLTYYGTHHLFFLYQPYYGVRYSSLFCEPGHIGMILSLLLYCLNYDLHNKKNLYLLINLLFTLSLAAYVLGFLGFILLKLKKSNLSIVKIISSVVALLFIIYLLSNIPVVNELIFSRLAIDSDSNTIAGDNRINYNAAMYFSTITFKEFFWGIGSKVMDENNIAGTGFYIHVMRYGLVSVILIFIYYLKLLRSNVLSFSTVSLFLLYIFSFYQRSYALWACELILFVSYISYSNFLYNGKDKIYNNHSKQKQ